MAPTQYTIQHGQKNTSTIHIEERGNDNATSVTVSAANVPINISVAFNLTSLGTMLIGSANDISMNISPLLGTPNGTYSFNLNVHQGSTLKDNITVNVIVPANYTWSLQPTSYTIHACIAPKNVIQM